jgi:hypothetical protein
MVLSLPESDSPSGCVISFHDFLAGGRVEAAAGIFSFAAAWRYWRDVAWSLGVGCQDESDFRGVVMAVFSGGSSAGGVSAYCIAAARHKIIGSVGSVVFDKESPSGANETAVATVIREDGRWKVRTYPGVFPGRLLVEAMRAAAMARGEGDFYE